MKNPENPENLDFHENRLLLLNVSQSTIFFFTNSWHTNFRINCISCGFIITFWAMLASRCWEWLTIDTAWLHWDTFAIAWIEWNTNCVWIAFGLWDAIAGTAWWWLTTEFAHIDWWNISINKNFDKCWSKTDVDTSAAWDVLMKFV